VSESALKIMNVMKEKHKVVNKVRHQSQKNLTLIQKKKNRCETFNEA
jgi:hypothetical protein